MREMVILVADDEVYVTTALSKQLGRRGYTVIVASNGQEALALANEHRPDLIVSDLQMPVMSGLEMAREAASSAATREIPIIMLTGRGHLLPSSDLSGTNIRVMLAKPFSIREVVGRIEDLLGGQPSPQEAAQVEERV